MGKEAKQTNMWKQKQNKQDKIKLGFLGSGLRTQEQACMHIIKPACTRKIICTQVLAQKPWKHNQA